MKKLLITIDDDSSQWAQELIKLAMYNAECDKEIIVMGSAK